jgi:hypothetical protein
METYQRWWRRGALALAGVSFVVGGLHAGWVTVAVATAGMAGLGALVGLSWVEDLRRERDLVLRPAAWLGLVGVVFVGLPFLLGDFTLLVVLLAIASIPQVVRAGLHSLRTLRQGGRTRAADPREDLSELDLLRMWRRTSDELRTAASSSEEVLRLVRERALLLDELEERDPGLVRSLLVRGGWQEPRDGHLR